jgi:hypothetical protein
VKKRAVKERVIITKEDVDCEKELINDTFNDRFVVETIENNN